MEWIFVLFLMKNGDSVIVEGYHPMEVVGCSAKIEKANPVFERMIDGPTYDAYFSGCFDGTIEELVEMLKDYKFPPVGDPA